VELFELLTLVNQVEFRLEMGKAVGSEHPLPIGVLQRLVRDPEFSRLYRYAQSSLEAAAGKTPEGSPPSNSLSKQRNLYQALALDDCVKFLLLESIERHNEKISVLAGFRAYLETALSNLWKKQDTKPEHDKPNGSGASIPLFFAQRRTNPIFQFVLASVMGASTVVPSVLLYQDIKEHQSHRPQGSKNLSPDNLSKSDNTAEAPMEEARIREEVKRRVNEILDMAGKLLPKEIKINDERCSRCPATPGVLNGTLALQFPKEVPEVKVTTGGPLISLFPQIPGKNPAMPTDFNLNLHLFGIPEPKPLPTSFKLEASQTPSYRVENLPASFAVVGPAAKPNGTAQLAAQQVNMPLPTTVAAGVSAGNISKNAIATSDVKVVFPVSFQAATTCDLTLSVDPVTRILKGTVKTCNHGMPPQIVSTAFKTPPIHDSAWHFVPEIGVMAKIEEHRTGFLGLGPKIYNITIQAVPFSNPELGSSQAGSSHLFGNTPNQPPPAPSTTSANPISTDVTPHTGASGANH